MGTIKFNGNEYPSAIVNFPFGERKISTIELNKCLMNNDGSYASENARLIDEGIFYFVEEDVIKLTESEIAKTILSEL